MGPTLTLTPNPDPSQITSEWSMDLRMVADEGEYLAQARAERNPTTYHPITRSPDHPNPNPNPSPNPNQACLGGDAGLSRCLAACGERNSGNSSMATAGSPSP